MKMSRLISVVLLGAALVAFTPVYAQRGGGGGGRSSSGSSSSHSSGSRGGGSFSSSRGSSSSHSSSSFSRSSSSSSSSFSRSGSSSSRSSSSFGSSSGISSRPTETGTRSSSSSSYRGSSSSSSSGLRGSGSESRSSLIGNDAPAHISRTGSVPSRTGSSQPGVEAKGRGDGTRGTNTGIRSDSPSNRTSGSQVGGGRPSGTPPAVGGGGGPHHHPHPSPYFMHPHHHHLVHCHQLYWDPYPPRHLYWPGFWVYCDSYWYDYHVTDIAVVHNYVKDTYNMELVAYAISGDYMYALVNDPDGHTYLQVYDKNDKLLAEQQVSRKYKKMEVDTQNGGCWIMKKRDKDPLLFLYADGQLLIYEADK